MDTRQRADQLRLEITQAERVLEAKRAALAGIYRACEHRFGDPVYDPIIQRAYTIPGDAVGTMGVDWRPPTHVPASETPRWRRTCALCGLTEHTTDTTTVESKRPRFRDCR